MNGISKICLAITLAGYGLCVDADVRKLGVEAPGYIRWHGVDITPQLKSTSGYIDNLHSRSVGAMKNTGTSFFSIDPSVEFKAQTGRNTYEVNLIARNMNYLEENAANYNNYGMLGEINQEFNSRNRLDIDWEYGLYHYAGSIKDIAYDNENDKKHLEKATDISPPEFFSKRASIIYGFGSMNATARFNLYTHISKQIFAKTRGVRDGDNKVVREQGADFFYELTPTIDAIIEAKKRNLKYPKLKVYGYNGENVRSQRLTIYRLGLIRETKGKLTGYMKGGQTCRETDLVDTSNQPIEEKCYANWDVNIKYMPVEHSVFNLRSQDRYRLESFNPVTRELAKSDIITLGWMHDWTSRIGTRISYQVAKNELLSSRAERQLDSKVKTLEFLVDWKIRPFLTLSLSYKKTIVDVVMKQDGSTDDSFRRNVFMMSMELAI